MIAHQPNPAPPSLCPAPASPAESPVAPPSPADEAILGSIFQPGATREQVSEAHHLSAAELALWLAQPHIQAAYQAMLALEAHFARQWAEQHIRTAVQTLTEIQQTSDDPTERRRAATTALRALRSGSVPAGSSARGRRADRESAVERAPSSTTSTASTRLTPVTPVTHSPLSSRPPDWWNSAPPPPSDPDATADLLISRLQAAGPDATLHTVLDIVEGPTIETEEGGLAFKAAYEQLAAALDGAVVTSTPAEPEADNLHALKRYTLTHPDDQGQIEFAVRLYCPSGTAWWLEEIIPLDSS